MGQFSENQIEQVYSQIIDKINDAIIAIDTDDRIILWNSGAQEIFGYPADVAIGKNIDIVIPEDKAAQELKPRIAEDLMKKGILGHFITRCRKENGEHITVELNLSSLRDESNNHIGAVGLLRDVSRIQKHLDEAERRNEEMEHLINMFSHDLKAPLYSIENYLDLLQEALGDNMPKFEGYDVFKRIRVNLANMETLIKDITDFSRAGLYTEDEMEINLNDLVEDIANNLQWQAGKENFNTTIHLLPKVKLNYRKIYQIFENLLVNAYKFRKDDKPVQVEVFAESKEDMIHFSIKDDGIGIDEKHHAKIFDLFYRTREKAVEGTGAGLAIARKAVCSMGGQICVESVPAQGATFIFTLPRTACVHPDDKTIIEQEAF